MKHVLVVHALSHLQRRTTVEFVSAFGRYAPDGVRVRYQNIRRPITGDLQSRRFDAVFLTYDLLSLRSSTQWAWAMEKMGSLCGLGDRVVAFPQDDYTHNKGLDTSLAELSTDVIFTPIETGLHIVYPTMHRRATILHAHTGYVDEETALARNQKRIAIADRPVHVGQRVRMLPPWFGRAGQEKGLFAERFAAVAREYPDLSIDISTRDEDAFVGEDWYSFLGSSRATIGQKGGASLCDPKGEIMSRVVEFQKENPNASFEEIESACFAGLDYQAEMKAISPRLFDAAMLGTAQILIEDDYLGEFEPWVHYIPTDTHVSNMGEIRSALRDAALLEGLATAARDALILSGRYTYRAFVQRVYTEAVLDGGHDSDGVLTIDAADLLQWRLSAPLFEALQRIAYLASYTRSTHAVADLFEEITGLLTGAPELIDYLDHRLLVDLYGEVRLGRGLDAVLEPLIDVVVEIARLGAGHHAARWIRSALNQDLNWGLQTWLDQDRVLLDEGVDA